jgi:AcrR family transcriptional regulator
LVATGDFEANRDRILAISAALFAENTYHGTGISELSAAVGLGRGALYHYIGSKESLLYEIGKTQVDRMNSFARDIVARGLPPEQQLHALAVKLLENISTHRAEWTVFFREQSALTGERRDAVIAAREQYEGYWRQTFEAGERQGVFQEIPPVLVKGILGMFNYTYLWFNSDGPLSSEQLANIFVTMILGGVRTAPGSEANGQRISKDALLKTAP